MSTLLTVTWIPPAVQLPVVLVPVVVPPGHPELPVVDAPLVVPLVPDPVVPVPVVDPPSVAVVLQAASRNEKSAMPVSCLIGFSLAF
jgi:hypothetical protein